MKIALLDLNHFSRGVHTNTVPLGLGLIAIYLKEHIKRPFDIRFFKDAKKCLSVIKTWMPDVIGLAQYSWNSELNIHLAKLIKQSNPKCLVVAGGPNLEFDQSKKFLFLKQNPCIDICVSYDGEIPFKETVHRYLFGEPIEEIRSNPVAGTYSIGPKTNKLAELIVPPPRIESLDAVGSIYTSGIFNELFDDGFHPFVQTHRGCPFTCAFCHTSDKYYSKMLFLSPDIFREDMEFLGKYFSGKHNVTLYIANTNMSLFKEDFLIAEIIRETQEKYDWPKLINVNSGKDPRKLLEMLSIIKFRPGIALQTLTPDVLNNIERKNIPFKEFIAFQHEVIRKTGETSATELILCLPGETRESFLETLRTVINSGVQDIVIYTLMNLKGTPLASEENVKTYSYTLRHRVVPRQFSEIDDVKILDTEEVIVGTKDMSYQEYLELRGLSFTITAFLGSSELIPLKRLLFEYNIDVADWIFSIHGSLPNVPNLYSYYTSFLKETENELFESREDLLDYFNKEENFEALRSGRLGDNLLRKYKCLILSQTYKSYLDLAVLAARELLNQNVKSSKANAMLDDLCLFLCTRDVPQFFKNEASCETRVFSLDYKIPDWLQNGDNSLLECFYEPHNYYCSISEENRRKMRDIVNMNKDLELSLQMLYRDGGIKDFWPVWRPIEK